MRPEVVDIKKSCRIVQGLSRLVRRKDASLLLGHARRAHAIRLIVLLRDEEAD